jgi:chromosome segregation ATPase
MTTLEDLDRRVTALERAQNDNTQSLKWVITKLAKVEVTLDEHTLRLQRVEDKIDQTNRQLAGLVENLPRIVAEAIRDAKT